MMKLTAACSGALFATVVAAASALAASTTQAVAGSEKVLFAFTNPDLAYPLGRVLVANGSLYTTGSGNEHGYGEVIQLPLGGKEKTLLKFNDTDGANPNAGLITDSSGALFGTTEYGGTYGKGNVFMLSESGGEWVQSTLWTFGAAGDGAYPTSDLVMDSAGNIYGTTYVGGADGQGAVFELINNAGTWSETLPYSFTGGSDGLEPYAGLLLGSNGALYGTTTMGGTVAYGGTVFELTQSGGVWTEQTIYSFTGGTDGYTPYGVLVADATGALYGTTYNGNANSDKCYGTGCGTVFKLTQSGGVWNQVTLHAFSGNDGGNPVGGLTWGPNSQTLYGSAARFGRNGGGTAFALKQFGSKWKLSTVHAFGSGKDGNGPAASVVFDASGNMYGTTTYGGTASEGTVWEITP
jgi:hypothetical protein